MNPRQQQELQAEASRRAGEWRRSQKPAARLGDYFTRYDPAVHLGPLVHIPRVSEDKPASLRSLADQQREMAESTCGSAVVGMHPYVGPSDSPGFRKHLRGLDAYYDGKVAFVFASVDRAKRPKAFDPKTNFYAELTPEELEELRADTGGRLLLTLADPGETPGNVRGLQTCRGLRRSRHEKATRQSPGYKKARRAELKPRALAMLQEGVTHRAIREALGVPISTVEYWKAHP